MHVALASALLVVATPAGAQDAAADSSGAFTNGIWTIESDADLTARAPRSDRRPPQPRIGFWAHGLLGDIEQASEIAARREQTCSEERVRAINSTGESRTEYWYFQSGGEGLVLVWTRSAAATADCRLRFNDESTIYRVTIINDGFVIFTRRSDGSYTAESYRLSDFVDPTSRDLRVGMRYNPVGWLALRKRRLSQGRNGDTIGALRTRCSSTSMPPDGGESLCWIASPGPSQGLVTSDIFLAAGSPYASQSLDRVENSRSLDGRLFEWDRTIRLVPNIR
jgi:hypothetical protein